ncbi:MULTISPECIES: enoyl-CoA hydratase-related protein [Streptomyces]|uniref:enoyl-CoA hydratase-related protein n=1 Tax=Streptomyces lycopersici TaxID=2974589 RepID=UPI0021D0C221|nr:enoyl-CoA hydratase-related protein [Streptomyces sp. NEAU-383]
MTSSPTEHGVRLETHGPIAEVVLDRPPVNAVTVEMYERLVTVFRGLSSRTDVHAVLLRSDVRMFSAGADIKQPVEAVSPSEDAAERRQRMARTAYEAILDCALPTIAVVNGAALGAGAVLAACCDIRYAARDARIGLPEITAGRCGGGSHLMRLLPQGQVRLMYFAGEPVDAAEAHRTGLVQRVAGTEEILAEARELAGRIAAKSPLGLRLAKRALNEAEVLPVRPGYAAEQVYTLRLGAHPDAAEAARAVLEKRAPVWSWPEVPES